MLIIIKFIAIDMVRVLYIRISKKQSTLEIRMRMIENGENGIRDGWGIKGMLVGMSKFACLDSKPELQLTCISILLPPGQQTSIAISISF